MEQASNDGKGGHAETADEPSAEHELSLTVLHKGKKLSFTLPHTSTLSDLSARLFNDLGIPDVNQKFLISPKPGLLKPPFLPSSTNGAIPITEVASRKITLLGSTPSEIASLNSTISASQSQARRHQDRSWTTGPTKAATPARTRDWKTIHDSTTYTFLQLRPLPYLPNPERSLRFLERLRDDAGIKATMAKHRWSVPLLTEMNPAEHTTQESRTLGLNRNAGEVIELRLRTDAYDGYRDYRTIRKTLCHELAHNVHGEHDRHFWDLCHEIEREVDKEDWRSGGHALSSQEFYQPQDDGRGDDDLIADHGGWTGGEYVLGSGRVGGEPSGVGGSGNGESSMSRRDILAKAAEERLKKQKERDSQPGPSGPSTPGP